MKLWLLDADVIIDLLGIDVFDKLVEHHEIYVSSTVAEEVKFFKKDEKKHEIDFKGHYIDSEQITELSASPDEIQHSTKPHIRDFVEKTMVNCGQFA